MDTRDIRCFVRVYEEQSISRAAGQLFITPQGLSKVIRHLEQELRCELFVRTRQGVKPTRSGTILYEKSGKLLRELEELRVSMEAARESDGEEKVSIGIASGVMNLLDMDLFIKYIRRHPEIKIDWREDSNHEVVRSVTEGSIDLAIAPGVIRHPLLDTRELCSFDVCAIVGKSHRFYERDSISVKDLEGEPLISLNEKFSLYHSLVERCEDFGFAPTFAIKTMESHLIYRFSRAGLGVGIDANIHTHPEMWGDLRLIRIEDAAPWQITAAWRKDSKPDDTVKAIMLLLRRD